MASLLTRLPGVAIVTGAGGTGKLFLASREKLKTDPLLSENQGVASIDSRIV